jgi:hypothetical protein
MKKHHIITIVAALLAYSAAEASAQIAAPSARGFALAGSYTTRARGYESPFWNPANLGLSGRPGFSIGLAGASAYLDNNSLSYGQITNIYGDYLDHEEKSALLAEIRGDDPSRMFELSFDAEASALGFSIGRFALSFGTVAAGNLEVTPDAAELLLFGNVGEDGNGRDFTLDGSYGQAWSVSGGSLSYAHPFTIPALDYLGMRFSAGASVKYGVAHGLVRLADQGTTLTYDPLALDVEAELINSSDADAGRAWAVDLGAAAEWGDWTVGLALANALADITWNTDDFEVTFITVDADFDTSTATDTTLSFAELSLEDQQRITDYLEEADLPKRLRLGVGYELSNKLSLSADYMEMIDGALRARWERQIAVGGELRLTNILPLRAGLATDFNNLAITGGVGIYAGPVHADFAIGRWGIGGGDGVVAAASISIWPGMGY